MTRFLIIFIILIVTLNNLSANNIQVSAPTLTGENRTEGYVYITFDLSWENSWRGTEANNWDAAWVFAKYRVGNGEWKHVKLHNNGHIAGSGTPATVDIGLRDDKQPFEPTGNPGVGVFMYRSAEGFGTFSTTGNKLRWNYTAEGITAGATVEVRVFAIEMVYVREGAFNVGGGGGGKAFFSTTINTPDARVAPSGVGSLGGMAGGFPSGFDDNYQQINIQPLFSDWPNGYGAFYCMKYEASQQQLVDFYNTLVPNLIYGLSLYQSIDRYYHRNTVTWNGGSVFSTSLPNIACNYLGSYCGSAYADWACLRPMTELEYEKACRGPLPPAPYWEFAWGTNQISGSGQPAPYSLSYEGTESEGIYSNYSSNIAGNANYGETNYNSNIGYTGPLRVGIFSANGANNGRITSGASYWGIMELSGNLWEQCITLNNEAGRSYRGTNGDGLLVSNGEYNVTDWPDWSAFFGRGGGAFNSFYYLSVSTRDYGQISRWGYSSDDIGFRGVRSPAQ